MEAAAVVKNLNIFEQTRLPMRPAACDVNRSFFKHSVPGSGRRQNEAIVSASVIRLRAIMRGLMALSLSLKLLQTLDLTAFLSDSYWERWRLRARNQAGDARYRRSAIDYQ